MEDTPEMIDAKHSLAQASKIIQHATAFVKKLQQPSSLNGDDTARKEFLSEVHTLACRTLKSAANWNIVTECSENSFNQAVKKKLSDQQDKRRYFELKGLAPWGQALEHLSPGHAGLEIFGTPVEPLNYPHLTYQTIPWDGLILADDWDEEVYNLMENMGLVNSSLNLTTYINESDVFIVGRRWGGRNVSRQRIHAYSTRKSITLKFVEAVLISNFLAGASSTRSILL